MVQCHSVFSHSPSLRAFVVPQAFHGSTNVQAETLLTSSSVVMFKVQLQDRIVSSRPKALSTWSKSLSRSLLVLAGLHLCFLLSLIDISFSTSLQLSSTSIAKMSTMCCRFLPVACDVNVAATSAVLLPGCGSIVSLSAALHTWAFLALETPALRVATCYNFLNSDCNARRW